MSLQGIVSSVVRSALVPVLAIAVFVVSALAGCATDEQKIGSTAADSGVFAPEYKAKYDEYTAFLKQLCLDAKTKFDANPAVRDEFYMARSKYDQARLGELMLKNGVNPAASPYPFLLLKVKAMQGCETELKKFDFMAGAFEDELKLCALMTRLDPVAVQAATAAVSQYPATDLTDAQLDTLASLRETSGAFQPSDIYISQYEDLAVRLTAAYDACKAEFDAGKLPEKNMVRMTMLQDKAHIGLQRLRNGLSPRPGLVEDFMAVAAYDYLYRQSQDDLQAGKTSYIQAFELGTEKLKAETAQLKDWRVTDTLKREVASFNLAFPRGPLGDDVIAKLVEVRARRAPAGGTYDYEEKFKELTANRVYLTGFCKAEYEAGRLPEEDFKKNVWLWDLDRLTQAGLEYHGNPDYAKALLTVKFNEYLLKNRENGKNVPAGELNNAKIQLFEAELDEIDKSDALSEGSLKSTRRMLSEYPAEPLKESRLKNLATPKKQDARSVK